MKKLFIIAVMVALTATAAIAAPPVVTIKMLNHFEGTFVGASNVQWKTTDSFVKASFTKDKQNWEAFYDLDGNLYGTSRTVTASDIPAKALACIAKKYTDYTPKEYIEFIHETEGKAFYVSLVNTKYKLIMEVDTEGNAKFFKRTKL